MTGGLGFTKQGQNAYRSNRELLNPRKRMKENPYASAGADQEKECALSYDELKQWRERKDKRENRWRTFIFIAVLMLTILAVLVFAV